MTEKKKKTKASSETSQEQEVSLATSTPASEALDELVARADGTDEVSSERVREAWDSLPGHETTVDYPKPQVPDLLPYASIGTDLSVDLVVTTPDGRRYSYNHSVEYADADTFEFEDIEQPLTEVCNIAMDALIR